MTAVPAEAEELIADRKLMAHIATCKDGEPHNVPVWYAYEDGHIRISTSGQKVTNLRQNPRAAISIQYDENGDAKWFVALRGAATIIEDPAEHSAAANRIFSMYLGDDIEQWDEYYREQVTGEPNGVLLDIDVEWASYQIY
ncbi:MAG: pyridoxamine 5'-phosphate oxidase family protein [Halobacteriales archaeon]|nr:pyridoxamine 5'-phosphate oxidase family protein [Halobacteriales archaeon]